VSAVVVAPGTATVVALVSPATAVGLAVFESTGAFVFVGGLLAAALFGTLLVHGTTFVLLVGVGMHLVALVVGLAIGPPLAWHRLRKVKA
jgi:hypothetical protein